MSKKTKKVVMDPIQSEIYAVKRLLILILLKMGTPQGEIAMALGVDQSVVSRMFSARKVTKFEIIK